MHRSREGCPSGVLQLYRAHRLADGVRALRQGIALLSGKLHFDDLFQAATTKLARDAEEEAGHPVLALEPRGTGKNALLIENDRLTHLDRRRRRSVVGRSGLEVFHYFRSAAACTLYDRVELCLRHELCDRDPTHG